jgi:hypothetical protein
MTRDDLSPRDRRAFDSIVDGLMWNGWSKADAVAQAERVFKPEGGK